MSLLFRMLMAVGQDDEARKYAGCDVGSGTFSKSAQGEVAIVLAPVVGEIDIRSDIAVFVRFERCAAYGSGQAAESGL